MSYFHSRASPDPQEPMTTLTDRTHAAVEVRPGNPVWRKAPTSLLRHRTLFAAVSIGAFLVVSSLAAYPLFLSASRDGEFTSECDCHGLSRTHGDGSGADRFQNVLISGATAGIAGNRLADFRFPGIKVLHEKLMRGYQ